MSEETVRAVRNTFTAEREIDVLKTELRVLIELHEWFSKPYSASSIADVKGELTSRKKAVRARLRKLHA